MHSDIKKRRSFLALLFASGDLRRSKSNIYSVDNWFNFGILNILLWNLITEKAKVTRKNTVLIFLKLKHYGMIPTEL